MKVCKTTIQEFPNYEVVIYPIVGEWHIHHKENGEEVPKCFNTRHRHSVYWLESPDGSGEVVEVSAGRIHRQLIPYLRDMANYGSPEWYPPITLEGHAPEKRRVNMPVTGVEREVWVMDSSTGHIRRYS